MCQLLLSGVGYVPTPNVHSDAWNCVESYMIYMLLAYLFIGTHNFHYCENYEPQKTIFFLLFVLSPYVSTFVECTTNSRSISLS